MRWSFVHLVVRAWFRGSVVPWSVVDCSQVELSCTRAEERKRKRFVSVRLSSYDPGFTIAEEKKSFLFAEETQNTKHETMMKAKIEESKSRSAKKNRVSPLLMTGIDAPSTSPVRIALAPPLASIGDAGSKRK